MVNKKNEIVSNLMEMLKHKNLDEITIKDLSEKTNITRQTFYHYFCDIYDAVEYIFIQETDNAISDFTNINNWSSGFLKILTWANDNKKMIMNVYNSIGREYIENFMDSVLYQYILKVVKDESTGINVTDEQISFIAGFYTKALNAVVLDWISKKMKFKPEELVLKVSYILDGNFKKALLKFEQENVE